MTAAIRRRPVLQTLTAVLAVFALPLLLDALRLGGPAPAEDFAIQADCPAGYGDPGDGSCADINECATNNGGCYSATVCTNLPGSFACGSCPFGFAGDGVTCMDYDECTLGLTQCSTDPAVACVNLVGGSYRCAPAPRLNGLTAWTQPNGGGPGQRLGEAIDMNECVTNNGGCQGATPYCTNLRAPFNSGFGLACSASCGPGTLPNGLTCTQSCSATPQGLEGPDFTTQFNVFGLQWSGASAPRAYEGAVGTAFGFTGGVVPQAVGLEPGVLTAAPEAALSGNAARTVMMWVVPIAQGGPIFVAGDDHQDGRAFGLRVSDMVVSADTTSGWGQRSTATFTAFTSATDQISGIGTDVGALSPNIAGLWTHVALSYDGADLKLYLNGSLAASRNYPNGIDTALTEIEFGRTLPTSAFGNTYFQGRLDEIQIFNRALTPGELSSIITAGPAGTCQATSCTAPPAEVTSWWSADMAAFDQQSGNHGALLGDATTAPGLVGNAFDLNGSTAYVEIPNAPGLDAGATFSIDAWVKPLTDNATARIVDKAGVGVPDGYLLELVDGYLRFQVGELSATSTAKVGAGYFNHVAATYDGATLWVYVNGYGSGSTAGAIVPVGSSVPLRIGMAQNGSLPFAGSIDEVQIFNAALTPSQVHGIYTSAGAGQCSVEGTVFTTTIEWPTPASIAYGTALGSNQLNAAATAMGIPVPGTFSYTPAEGTVLEQGTHQVDVVFTPADSVHFTAASASTSLLVTPAIPQLTWTDPADISYGTALSAAQLNATASVAGSFSYAPASGTVLAPGAHSLSTTFTPESANYSIAGTSATLTVTAVAPIVTVPAPITAEAAGPDGASVTFAATATDVVDGALTPACVPVAGATFALGATNVTCSATSTVGTTGSSSFAITVKDTTPPSITVPESITTPGSAAGAMVTFAATATDLVDGTTPVTCLPASGSTFALGTTTVNCSATDAAENSSQASFDVMVELDSDSDGAADTIDPDDDNDGAPDALDAFPFNAAEQSDADSDGTGNNADPDDDNDGVPDAIDAFPFNALESIDTDGDGIGNNADDNDDGDSAADVDDAFPLDEAETVDTDNDGVGNNADLDDDGDLVADVDDAFPMNGVESVDTDSDGTGNNADTDDDADGTADGDDAFPLDAAEQIDTDADGTGNNADDDDDNDGAADAVDAFPLNAAEQTDTDSDGTGNNADTDDDNDGTPDATDAFPLNAAEQIDTDGDGTGNNGDTDDDNDGVGDSMDAFPLDAAESRDNDHDGAGDNADTDDDNDGVPDTVDAFPLDGNETIDTDGDGLGNQSDPDDDNDGAPDASDAFPLNAAEQTDTDGDGSGNNADTDDDNDGTADVSDAFPLNPTEQIDTDGDGTGNNADGDDDNDGVGDAADAFPLNPAESTDIDSDGTGNNADVDDDNDGTLDANDAFPLNAAEQVDTDGDGQGNNADADDDNDGIPDAEDPFPTSSGLRQTVQTIVTSLPGLVGQVPSSQADNVRRATRHLIISLAQELWQDEGHLTDRGRRVFNQQRLAVRELASIRSSVAPVTSAIASIVSVDRGLASLAITEAVAAGGDARLIALAIRAFARGDALAGTARPARAVEAYGEAWALALRAVRQAPELYPAATELRESIAGLTSLLTTGIRTDDQHLTRAIAGVQAALASNLWIDASHLAANGATVFTQLSNALDALARLTTSSPVSAAVAETFTTSARAIARAAIDEAQAAGGRANDLDRAEALLRRGDDDTDASKGRNAIDFYRQAWTAALGAVR